MPLTEQSEKALLSSFCQRIYKNGYTPACSGNISLRDANGMFITPSGWCLGDVYPNHVVHLSKDGKIECETDGLKPSSEKLIHQKIYESRDSIQAIVHAHPPKSIALCLAGIALDEPMLAEVLLTLGKVPLVPYILPGSDRLASALHDTLKNHHATLMANHGVITTGKTLQEAYYRLELVESLAESVILAKQLGGTNTLTKEQVQEIFDAHGHPEF